MDDGEPPDRVAEAADATASAYTQDADLDIRKRLVEKSSEGASATPALLGSTTSSTPSALATPVTSRPTPDGSSRQRDRGR